MKFLQISSLVGALFLSASYARYIDNNYNKRDILSETNWEKMSVQHNAPIHLSIISQGKYNDTGKYDKNYYYPSTAGEGIEVFMFDNGFSYNNKEFSDIEANIEAFIGLNGVKKLKDKAKELGIEEEILEKEYHSATESIPDHGTVTSSAVAGKNLGVAKKATLHGLVIDVDYHKINKEDKFLNDIVYQGIKYVKDNGLIVPHKTVFNFSLREYIDMKDFKTGKKYNETQALINEVSEMGVVIIAGAGNESKQPYYEDKDNEAEEYAMIPCDFDNVICVGGIGSNTVPGINNDEIDSSFYSVGKYYNEDLIKVNSFYGSNYGNHVDIYAPFIYHYHDDFINSKTTASFFGIDSSKYEFVETEYGDLIKDADIIIAGTSMSSPIVAGVAATIMSEKTDEKFTTKTMLEYLTKIGIKGVITDVPDDCPNVFINNGRKNDDINDDNINDDINDKVEEPTAYDIENESDVEVDIEIIDESDSDFDENDQ